MPRRRNDMSKQLIVKDGKYYFVDGDTLEVTEVHFDKPVLSPAEQNEILKLYIRENKS
jgi:hypothetical protein